MSLDSLGTKEKWMSGSDEFSIHAFDRLDQNLFDKVKTLPLCLCILLENLLRYEDGKNIKKNDIEASRALPPKILPPIN